MSIEEEVKNIKDQLADVSAKYRMMQADYNARLKADMVAMLEEISLKFDEQYYINRHELHDDFLNRGLEQGQDIIQQKIDKLRGNENGNDER